MNKTHNQRTYDLREKKRWKAIKRRERKERRDRERACNNGYRTVEPKPGIQPVSILSADHPARQHGWHSDEAKGRNRDDFE